MITRVLQRWRTEAVLAAVLGSLACAEALRPDPTTALEFGPNRLSASSDATCALDAVGKTYCWGHANTVMKTFGTNDCDNCMVWTPVAAQPTVLAMLAVGGSDHRCGITSEGDGLCWGRSSYGQLGGGTAIPDFGSLPTSVAGTVKWKELSTGRITTCGISVDGDAYCWGFNQRGEIGSPDIGMNVRTWAPNKVAGNLKLKSIAPGWMHTCGLTEDGAAWCWGNNGLGELGIGTTDTVAHRSPEPVSGGHHFTQLTSGWRITCGITTEKEALCWGYNELGQLGDGTTTTRVAPTPVAGGHTFVRIATGYGGGDGRFFTAPTTAQQNGVAHACALTDKGKAYCWGWNGAGQLGDSSSTSSLTPVAVRGGLTFTSIAAGANHSCGMRGNAIWCWGSNSSSQLGQGYPNPSPWPNSLVPVSVASPFAKP